MLQIKQFSLKPDRHLLLDVDGTLWDSRHVVATAWNTCMEENGLSDRCVTPDDLSSLFGKPMDKIADELFTGLPREKKDALMEICIRYEEEALAQNTASLLYPDVRDTFALLTGLGVKLYIVSNCQDGYIEQFLEKNELGSFITDYESYGRTGLYKAENILLVMERNNIPRDKVFYVGDIEGDYLAATKAGVPFIHAAYGFGRVKQAIYTVKRFKEVIPYCFSVDIEV